VSDDVRTTRGLDEPLIFREAVMQMLLISLELDLLLVAAIAYRCGPLPGLLVFGVAPVVTIPIAGVLFVIFLVTMLALPGAKRTGTRRTWRRVHRVVFVALLATLAAAAFMGLSADGTACGLS
jgi:hypothetical protein